MSNYDQLLAIIKELLFNRFYPKPDYIRGLLGDGQGNVLVPGRVDYNYVRFNRSSTERFEVFNKEVSQPVDGWPVLIGEFPWQPGLVQVVATDWSAYAQTGWGNDVASLQAHAHTHEWPPFLPGSDAINVYLRAMTPLRTQSAGSGSASVYVTAYEYDGSTGTNYNWPGVPPLPLGAATPPTGSMRYMGVYLNPATNALGVVTGATTVYTDSLEPPAPSWPRNVFPSAYVRLYGGQAGITERDIRDARRLWDTTALAFTGTMAAASQAEVDAGTDTTKAVTPATLTNRLVLRVPNTSGATANAGEVGYLNEAGEYKTTTTASDVRLWCVVVTGGANGSTIYVARSGRWTVAYTGTDPAAGHFLVTSTSAGDAQRQTYVDPAIFAVCMAAGSGGTVDALLLCNRAALTVSSVEDVVRVSNHSGTDFTGTIAAKSGANVEYTTTGGTFEDSIKPASAGELGKIVLHNTTRGTSALIDSVNLTNTATPASGTITLTATAPAGWQVGDAITTRSQTNTTTITGGSYFIDVDLSSVDNTLIPPLAVVIKGSMLYQDSTATVSSARSCLRHPFETDAASKRDGLTLLVGNSLSHRRYIDIPLIQRKFCINCASLGAGTATFIIRLSEVVVAAP